MQCTYNLEENQVTEKNCMDTEHETQWNKTFTHCYGAMKTREWRGQCWNKILVIFITQVLGDNLARIKKRDKEVGGGSFIGIYKLEHAC